MSDDTGTPSQDGRPDLNDPNTHLDRNAAMKLMTERRRETVQEDMDPTDAEAFRAARNAPAPAAATPEAPAQDAPAVDPTTPAARAAQVERQRAEPTVIEDADLANFRVRRKVNGVETIVGLDELRASAQKVDAADEYLAKAKTTLAELDTVTKQARAMAAQVMPNQPAAPTGSTPSPTDDGLDAASTFVDNMFGGDDVKAKEALRQLMKFTAPSAKELARAARQEMVINDALERFAKDHRDIATDPTLRQKADAFLYQELASRGATKLEDLEPDQISDVIAQAGTQTKDWLRSVAGVPASPPPSSAPSFDDKRRAKQGIDELPTASVRSTSVVAPPRTAVDTIAAMAAARNPMSNPRPS